ncbi:MAG: segregation/condensation protein, partial [Oerskovia sp.]|nr:segregation/condensation protein [Oerskovia sp.]
MATLPDTAPVATRAAAPQDQQPAPPSTDTQDATATPPAAPATDRNGNPAFEVHLENFSGPFDLLLSL